MRSRVLAVLVAVVLLLPAACGRQATTTTTAPEPTASLSAAPSPTPSSTPEPAAPTQADLADAALTLPPWCADFVGADPASPVRMSGGSATVGGEAPYATTVTLTSVTPVTWDGEPAAAAVLDCFGGGAHSYDALALYDPDLALVGSWAPMERRLYDTAHSRIQGVDSTRDGLDVTVDDVRVVGDTSEMAATGSATATVHLAPGAEAALTAVHLGGRDLAVPSTRRLQDVYDALAAGTDPPQVSANALHSLRRQMGDMGEWISLRDLVVLDGGRVLACSLASDNLTLWAQGDAHLEVPDTAQPVDFRCPVSLAGAPGSLVHDPADGTVLVWLVVRPGPTPDDFQVTDLAIGFS